MKLAIIADDLTGANDSGVQLAKYGLKTSVFLKMDAENVTDNEAIVFDTDSRALDGEEAKQKVEEVTKFLLDQGVTNLYKKIDSTMRGNIGQELIGFQHILQSDFVFVAPGYPKNGRKIIDGVHYLNGKPLGETEIANDPVTPVKESHLPTLIKNQINEEVGLINLEVLRSGPAKVEEHLKTLNEHHITYIVVDSETEEDLELLLETMQHMDYRFGWIGSAGLANYLPNFYQMEKKELTLTIPSQNKPILTVVGSVNVNSRRQLQTLLEEKEIVGIKMDSYKAISPLEVREREISRVYKEAESAAQKGKDVVIYSAGEKEDISYAREVGVENGYNFTQTSSEIVSMIGNVASDLLDKKLFQGIVMTGGDTAKKICDKWGVAGFQLCDELEVGVPISQFIGVNDLYTVTKAGGFGKDRVLIDAIACLKGGHYVEQ